MTEPWHERLTHDYQADFLIAEEVSEKLAMAKILGNLGNVYTNLEQWAKAIESYTQALEIFWQLGHTYGEAKSLHNLGILYGRIGQTAQAIELFEEALAKFPADSTEARQIQSWLEHIGFKRP